MLGSLGVGQFFGERSCLLLESRPATLVAKRRCELYSLSREVLDEVGGVSVGGRGWGWLVGGGVWWCTLALTDAARFVPHAW